MPQSPQPQTMTTNGSAWIKAPASLVFSLPPELLATFLRIRYYDRGQGCWASVATLGAGLVSERQVRRHIRELERRGLVRVVARESRTSIIYCQEPASNIPTTSDRERKVQKAEKTPPPGRQLPAKQIHEVETDPKNYNENAATEEQVLSVVVPCEAAGILPFQLPGDLAELPHKRKGIGLAMIRRLVGEHGIEVVRQAVNIVSQQYPDDTKVRSFGALLSVAVREGWRSPKLDDRAGREVREAAMIASTPPAETRWAKPREGGLSVQVVEVAGEVVRTATGVIPRHRWPEWEWFTTSEAEASAHKAQEGPRNIHQLSQHPPKTDRLSSEPDETIARRRDLARLAARCSSSLPVSLRRTPDQLVSELSRLGLAVGDLMAYIQAQQQA